MNDNLKEYLIMLLFILFITALVFMGNDIHKMYKAGKLNMRSDAHNAIELSINKGYDIAMDDIKKAIDSEKSTMVGDFFIFPCRQKSDGSQTFCITKVEDSR